MPAEPYCAAANSTSRAEITATESTDCVRKRRAQQQQPLEATMVDTSPGALVAGLAGLGRQNQWIFLALVSGACAAFNGVFAKLTTTELTSTLSQGVARFLHLSSLEGVIEVIFRGAFFGLNLVFNGVMWTLFTQALAKGNSTTQVSIMNTSANFVITAVLSSAIFSESLSFLWWIGATLLVAGNVIIGQKDEGASKDGTGHGDANDASSAVLLAEDGLELYRDEPSLRRRAILGAEKDEEEEGGALQTVDEDVPDLGDLEEREGT